VSDFNLVAVQLTHENTNTQHLHIAREDSNNAFWLVDSVYCTVLASVCCSIGVFCLSSSVHVCMCVCVFDYVCRVYDNVWTKSGQIA